MPTLEKQLRNQLERTVKDARDVAEAGARAAIEQFGVGDAAAPDHLNAAEKSLRKRLRIHGRQLGDEAGEKKGSQGIERLVEEVAYEHWHRMLFARFLAENNLLMYPDPDEPVAVSLAECDDLAADEGASNGWELASRFAAKMLPAIFRVESPVFGLELPPEHQQRLERLVGELPTDVFTASDSLGWVYQFWQANRKEAINKSEVKIGARELPAVTQLFTEDYMVDFLLDNTLGAWWAGKQGGTFPCSDFSTEAEVRNSLSLPGCEWQYLRFISEPTALAAGPSDAEGNREKPVASASGSCWRPAAGTFDGWPKTAKELTCLDPCMGSGHFVVGMFERLVALRMAEEGISEVDAVAAVIKDNLFGLEIDPRCTQIAAFNLAFAAWRRIGYQILPPMNLACSGLAPNTTLDEWLALAAGNQKLESGMERLYRLFENAPVLGSLINPRAGESTLIEAGIDELHPLLEQVFKQDKKDDVALEMVVAARGVANAAEILASEFTLVATNLPYLGRSDQCEFLQKWSEEISPNGKWDIATTFLKRLLYFGRQNLSTLAVVSPHEWWFLKSWTKYRHELLSITKWHLAATLGEEAWESFGIRGPKATLLILDSSIDNTLGHFGVIEALPLPTIKEKIVALRDAQILLSRQEDQKRNPDYRITTDGYISGCLLSEYAISLQGVSTADSPRFVLCFWETHHQLNGIQCLQGSLGQHCMYGGRESVIKIEALILEADDLGAAIRGRSGWGRPGVAIRQLRSLHSTIYSGDIFDSNIAVIVPHDKESLRAIWAFCSSEEFTVAVRRIDKKKNVTNGTMVKVPFDLEYWQKVADEKYPDGLPKPFSSDPTQWLFNGHPYESDQPLQVAVARLVGYQWPRQTGSSFPDCPALGPDGLEPHADQDGIVCIPPVRGEAGAADRLLNLLAAAYGDQWNSDVLSRLLTDAGYAGKGLEIWLRDGFFAQHLDIFHKRPFVWHIWDGLRDGFAALVNYHKLDRKNLETLIYTYLGNWIDRQKQNIADGIDGAEEKLAGAQQLKKRLELILHGEAPYDIFVRWKPLHQQPIGWQPDINDGVRMNIRPFVTVADVKVKGAGILRVNPKIKWDKDRGKEPQRSKQDYPWFWGWDGKTTDFPGGPDFKGERFNDCHYTLAAKNAAKQIALSGKGV